MYKTRNNYINNKKYFVNIDIGNAIIERGDYLNERKRDLYCKNCGTLDYAHGQCPKCGSLNIVRAEESLFISYSNSNAHKLTDNIDYCLKWI